MLSFVSDIPILLDDFQTFRHTHPAPDRTAPADQERTVVVQIHALGAQLLKKSPQPVSGLKLT